MTTRKRNRNEMPDDEEGTYEIGIEQVTHDTITIRANSRSEAIEAVEEPNQPREVQEELVRKDFRSLSERRPESAVLADEYDADDNDLEPDVDLTE